MPIVIDTETEASQQDLDKQIKKVTKKLAVNKQLDAKYFSKSLTGNGKRKDGVFPHGSDTINEFIANRRRLLEFVREDDSFNKTWHRYNAQEFGNFFHQSTKKKEIHFEKFENNLTSIAPPILLYGIIENDAVETALSFPRNTPLYDMRNLESTWHKITTGTVDGKPTSTYIKPVIQSVRLYSKESVHKLKSGHDSKTLTIAGQPEIYIITVTVLDDMDKNGDIVFVNQKVGADGKRVEKSQGVASISYLREYNRYTYDYTRLYDQIENHLTHVIDQKGTHMTLPTKHALELTIGDISMTETLKEQAVLMSKQTEDILIPFVDALSKRVSELMRKPDAYVGIYPALAASLVAFVQHIDLVNTIEDNVITTDLLAKIYATLNNNFEDKTMLHKIARHSLRLLLSQRLHELDEIKHDNGLYEFKPDDDTVNDAMQKNQNYSVQQKKIITTTDPLVIGQAGAGSGKSHTLIGRINYMIDQGEDVSKALVLSFTNVSAINITNRFPGVRSETLANMFHTIYSATFPRQSLSQASTVANAMRLLNVKSKHFAHLNMGPNALDAFIQEFATRLSQFDQTGFKRVDLQQELKRLSNLIEGNVDVVTTILDAVEQTTLELEPIIIHHKLLMGGDGLNIPQEYQDLNYIITDESQDISTFEYILLLELTIHYRSQLLIIGDGSQTLYEFRNSDPRYMNALESSNVFTSHKLETNYRSNEEILIFANQFLKIIDANKYANIQLKSSKFTTPTVQSLRETVAVSDNELENGVSHKDYTNSLVEFIESDDEFHDWFIDRVQKKEQIAFMGWTRAEVIAVGEALEKLLAQHNLSHVEITNIMSNNERPMTILSRFAHDHAADLRGINPTDNRYMKKIDAFADAFIKKAFTNASPRQAAFYSNYINNNVDAVRKSREWQAWSTDFANNRLTEHQVGSYLIQALIRLETRKNAMDQYLRKQKDVPNYDECPILLSTIHGTKGLEFDHTVVMFNEAKRAATSQESLRMMFVALSRAKKSEFIINSYKPSKHRVIGSGLTDMLQTPMRSAFVRTLDDVKALQAANTAAQSATATQSNVNSANSTDDVSADAGEDSSNTEDQSNE